MNDKKENYSIKDNNMKWKKLQKDMIMMKMKTKMLKLSTLSKSLSWKQIKHYFKKVK